MYRAGFAPEFRVNPGTPNCWDDKDKGTFKGFL